VSKLDKLIVKLKSKPKDFTWGEAVKLMGSFDYKLLNGSSGSHRKFYNEDTKDIICMSQPHPKEILKSYQIKDLCDKLKEIGKI